VAKQKKSAKPFLTDVKTLRDRARKNIASGGVTFTYEGDVKKTIDILQAVLATEIVCVLRYTMHAVAAQGISSEGVKAEFAQHAKEEQGHMNEVAERINQLGGVPDFNPTTLTSRAASEYGTAGNLVEMIKENLIAERIGVHATGERSIGRQLIDFGLRHFLGHPGPLPDRFRQFHFHTHRLYSGLSGNKKGAAQSRYQNDLQQRETPDVHGGEASCATL